ncbi:1872_t:CDS:2 [Dentiscutata erythropus]|uniref:1872_t:CDS:1 n=1 Tax=Dentiscutata erythropus TaxID=1348616 RepID=A0A9N9HYJ4_9GLOM|nr:1872_t:CDS:2 [Dentiscutata erythropus]
MSQNFYPDLSGSNYEIAKSLALIRLNHVLFYFGVELYPINIKEEEILNSRQEAPNPRSDDEHISILEDNQQDNPDPHQQEIPDSRQETPTPNSHSDQDNQNSRNIYNHSTFNNCTFNNYYYS